jgi:hypothetical protein
MSNEWKNIRDEFPSQIGKLYIVRATRDEFTIYYICKLVDLGGWVELTGYSPYGRRFSVHEPKAQPQILDIFETEQPLVMWRTLDA